MCNSLQPATLKNGPNMSDFSDKETSLSSVAKTRSCRRNVEIMLVVHSRFCAKRLVACGGLVS